MLQTHAIIEGPPINVLAGLKALQNLFRSESNQPTNKKSDDHIQTEKKFHSISNIYSDSISARYALYEDSITYSACLWAASYD